MGEFGEYLLSILTISLICAVILNLSPSGSKEWIRLLCGLVVTATVLTPISKLLDIEFPMIDPQFHKAGEDLRFQGESLSKNAMADIITANLQAYILDKANALGASVQAEIFVSEDTIPIPVSVTLKGSIAPYARLQLQSIIENELGITKEYIRWMD